MYQKNKDLLDAIQEKRLKMIDTAKKNGLNLTNEETLKGSQELDQLIFHYQRKIHKNSKRQEGKKVILPKLMMMLPNLLANA